MTDTRAPVVITELVIKQVAAYDMMQFPQVPATVAARALGTSVAFIKKCRENAQYKEIMEKAGEDALKPALIFIRSQSARLAPKLVKALEHALDENDLAAVPHVLKILGLSDQKESSGDTNIQVIIPGSPKPETPVENIVIEGTEE